MQKFAHIVSNFFQPLLIPTFGMLLLFQVNPFSETEFYYKAYTVFSIFVLTAIIPFLGIVVLKKAGVVSSILLDIRKERTIPYIIAIVCYITAIAFLWRIYMPIYIVAMMLASLIATLSIVLINLKWKISAHLCGMGSLCAAIFIVTARLGIANPYLLAVAFIAAGLVASARLILKVHTPMQTLAGFTLGFTLVALFGSLNIHF